MYRRALERIKRKFGSGALRGSLPVRHTDLAYLAASRWRGLPRKRGWTGATAIGDFDTDNFLVLRCFWAVLHQWLCLGSRAWCASSLSLTWPSGSLLRFAPALCLGAWIHCGGTTPLPATWLSGTAERFILAFDLTVGLVAALHHGGALHPWVGLGLALHLWLCLDCRALALGTSHYITGFVATIFLLVDCRDDRAAHWLRCSAPSRISKGNTTRMGSRRSQLSTSTLFWQIEVVVSSDQFGWWDHWSSTGWTSLWQSWEDRLGPEGTPSWWDVWHGGRGIEPTCSWWSSWSNYWGIAAGTHPFRCSVPHGRPEECLRPDGSRPGHTGLGAFLQLQPWQDELGRVLRGVWDAAGRGKWPCWVVPQQCWPLLPLLPGIRLGNENNRWHKAPSWWWLQPIPRRKAVGIASESKPPQRWSWDLLRGLMGLRQRDLLWPGRLVRLPGGWMVVILWGWRLVRRWLRWPMVRVLRGGWVLELWAIWRTRWTRSSSLRRTCERWCKWHWRVLWQGRQTWKSRRMFQLWLQVAHGERLPFGEETDFSQGKGASYWKGKGYGGKNNAKGWNRRPYFKGNFKGKKGYGKSKNGKKGFSRFGKGSWFTSSTSTETPLAAPVLMASRGLDITDGIPDESTKMRRQASHNAKEYVIHTSSEEQEEVLKLSRSSNQEKNQEAANTDKTTEKADDEGSNSGRAKKTHSVAFSFASSFHDNNEYFVVRGQKRRGLLIDPGAASGLIGSETLRDLLETCVYPFGTQDNYEIRYDRTSPVSGINGASDRTLGQVTVPLQTNGQSISYTGEILGGQGSLCPALVGNPALRSMNSVLFTNYFENGDGLLSTDYVSEKDGEEIKRFKLFRLLLTESGHYLLPTDEPGTKNKLPDGTRQEVVAFYTKVVKESMRLWNDVSEKMRHCFFSDATLATQTEGDRGDLLQPCEDPEECGKQETAEMLPAPDSLDKIGNKEAQDVSLNGILLESQFSHDTHNEEKPCDLFHNQEAQLLHSDEEIFPRYKEDQIPENMDHNKMVKRYRAIPEEFYSKSGFRPITPSNFPKWFQRARNKGLKWHFWEICSGSGRLSLTLLLAGLVIVPPIDARYGWDLNDLGHQRYLNMARDEFAPGVIHCSPDCAPWSVSSNLKDPELRHLERLRDQPGLAWIQETCEHQDAHDRGYVIKQPLGSAMMKDGPETPIHLERIQGNRAKQRVDQCMHEARDERGWLIQKATGLSANFKFVKTALRCSGHNGQQHSHLQGQAPNGLSRTSMAAVYPKTMCQRMRLDIIRYLDQKKLLNIKAWPKELSWFSAQHFYECVRCTLGRSCPKGIEHTMIPGQCRHGKWAAGTEPETKSDPVKRWKTTTNKETMEQVILNNNSNIEMTVECSHWLKKMLMETVHNALGLFSEASNRKVEYEHWIDNALMLSLFKEVFNQHMEVKAVKASLRPFKKSPPNPQVVSSTAYLRLHIVGNVKEWQLHPIEDLREMSHNQIHADIEVEDWLVTVYGQELGTVPAPSTPTTRPRSIPPQPELPPRQDDAALLPQVRERPADPEEQVAIQEAPYEEFDAPDRKDLDNIKPIKPNYNIRRVLHKLPSLVTNGDNTRARQLLLGLHERLWHTPVSDFVSLLRRAGMPTEVLEQAREAVAGCAVCRKYIRLPNRPQTRTGGAHVFNEAIQIDLFNMDGTWFLIMLDEATRFKMCSVVEGQESDQLLSCILKSWIYMFGPPFKIVMDQQCSLMGHETAAEFERLGMTRVPKGTTAGQGAEQHTGTGLVERHVQLLKLTMLKLRAELARQGLPHDLQDLCQEGAMAHNITLNYGGATPSMAVFGMLPRGFYELDSDGIMTTTGALQTDVTPFERAIRIRQTALAQTQQAIAEDRVARASRTKPHQLKLGELTAGTSEVEFCREVKGDPGWRGPALLLRLDEQEGTAVIQYQGKPYLVALRHIRPYQGIFMVEVQNETVETALHHLMRYVESLTDYKIYMCGWLQKKNGSWYKVPKDEYPVKKVMHWAEEVSKSLRKQKLHGIMMGKSLRTFKPPSNTTGTLLSWLRGGRAYSIMECKNANHLQVKKFSGLAREDLCVLYFYYYQFPSAEMESVEQPARSVAINPSPPQQPEDGAQDMQIDPVNRKRDGPETRTVVLAPERKKQKMMMVRRDLEFLRMFYIEDSRNKQILVDFPEDWRIGYDLMTIATRNFLLQRREQERAALPVLFNIEYKQDSAAIACLRTAKIYKVDDETKNIEDEAITPELWDQVDAADKAEIAQFVNEGAFKKIHKDQITAEMTVVDARWIRKWKRHPDRSLRVKSRLCARGFLDKQKGELTTRSTTATRLSQRILVSHAASDASRTLESIDISGAFLKGFNFEQIREALRQMGIDSPHRTVIIIPPLNVFRHLAELSDKFHIPEHQIHDYALLAIKPIYGLNDAPLAWQLCLHNHIKDSGGQKSHLDENTFSWKENGDCIAMATTHVDDIAISAPIKWINNTNESFTKRFGKVTRQQLPFSHCGCEYTMVYDGYKICQKEFAEKVKPAPVPNRPDSSRLTKEELSNYRSILGALLWLTATRLDLIADISLLQSRVTIAEVKDLKQANQVLEKVLEFKDVGLYYRHFRTKHRRLVCIHDASSASKGRNYAQEGILVGLADDLFYNKTLDTEMVFDDAGPFGVQLHGGVFHILHSSGGKAKRVSYSTSHAETLSMVGGMETTHSSWWEWLRSCTRRKLPAFNSSLEFKKAAFLNFPWTFTGTVRTSSSWWLVHGLSHKIKVNASTSWASRRAESLEGCVWWCWCLQTAWHRIHWRNRWYTTACSTCSQLEWCNSQTKKIIQ